MLDTAKETYNAFLDGIKKSYTGTVKPAIFTRLMNDWGLDEWLKQNVSLEEGVEVTQKQIDDLQNLKVITDGVQVYNSDIMYSIIPDATGSTFFTRPDGITPILNTNSTTTAILAYPKYLRLLNVMFKITYVNNVCDLTGTSDWLKAQVMRSNERPIIMDNYYFAPADDNLYYELTNEKVKLITGTSSTPYSMKLEYLRMPNKFYFDANRKIKACFTISTNGLGVGTVDFSLVTPLGTYTLTNPLASVPTTLNESKYVIAKAIYDAIQADTVIPASVKNYTTLNGNSICIGQYGYDVTSLTMVTTGTPPTITTPVLGTEVSDVNLDLGEQQRKEVVEQAVRIYLERVTDARYKSYFTEEAVREQGKK